MNDPQCASKSILSIYDHAAAELLLAKYNTIKIGRYISDVHHQIYIYKTYYVTLFIHCTVNKQCGVCFFY